MKYEIEFCQSRGSVIQSNGALVAFRPEIDVIEHASANCHEVLGHRRSDAVIGRTIGDVLGTDLCHALKNVASFQSIRRRREHIGQCTLDGVNLDMSAFEDNDNLVCEFETVDDDAFSAAYDVLKDVLLFIDRVLRTQTVDEMLADTANLLRTITGFDCVSACRYADREVEVLTTSGVPLSSDLRWQATDQINAIVDVDYSNVAILLLPRTTPPDLNLSLYRAPLEESISGLRRAGARACASQGIVVNDHVWGYLTFLHRAPRALSQRSKLVLLHLQPLIAGKFSSLLGQSESGRRQ